MEIIFVQLYGKPSIFFIAKVQVVSNYAFVQRTIHKGIAESDIRGNEEFVLDPTFYSTSRAFLER